MDDVWSWIASLPAPSQWPPSSPSLAVSADGDKSILLSVDRTAGSDAQALITFSISLRGFQLSGLARPLWISKPLPSTSPQLPLLLQLLEESICFSSPHPSICCPSPPPPKVKLHKDSVAEVLVGDEHASSFFSLVLFLRIFWLCAIDAPGDAGFLFFRSLDGPLVRALNCRRALRGFLLAVGPDVEERLMRSLGYMLSKWCLLSELQLGSRRGGGGARRLLLARCCPFYVADKHGLWILKGFAPVPAMTLCGDAGTSFEAKDSVLRYSLAHQQLEAVVQMEYVVCMRDPRFIRVSVGVNNLRFNVVRLRLGQGRNEPQPPEEEDGGSGGGYDVEEERHFPSRVRIWIGPEYGSTFATGPSLGRSSGNPEREVETTRTVKGQFGGGKASVPDVKAAARTAARVRGRSWRWEQEAEGGAGVFEGVLCEGTSGAEVASWRPAQSGAGGGGGGGGDPRSGMRRRHRAWGRALSKSGGVVVAEDELPEAVEWRVGREMEGEVVRWRVGARVWVSYMANEVRTSYFETRSVEWSDELQLSLLG